MNNRRWFRMMSLVAGIGLVVSVATGCDGDEVTIGENDDNTASNDDPNDDPNSGNHGHNHHDEDYFEAHGPDEDEELIDAGVLQGSWRAAFDDGDRPLAYFDIFHDEGESTASGDFTQGLVPHEMYDGTTGSIDEVVIDGEAVQIHWNPTDAGDEMFSVDLNREDDDRYTGIFEAAMYPNTYDVTVTRMDHD